jgi:hypothetical protein
VYKNFSPTFYQKKFPEIIQNIMSIGKEDKRGRGKEGRKPIKPKGKQGDEGIKQPQPRPLLQRILTPRGGRKKHPADVDMHEQLQ